MVGKVTFLLQGDTRSHMWWVRMQSSLLGRGSKSPKINIQSTTASGHLISAFTDEEPEGQRDSEMSRDIYSTHED
jgi:hypothetical protein